MSTYTFNTCGKCKNGFFTNNEIGSNKQCPICCKFIINNSAPFFKNDYIRCAHVSGVNQKQCV